MTCNVTTPTEMQWWDSYVTRSHRYCYQLVTQIVTQWINMLPIGNQHRYRTETVWFLIFDRCFCQTVLFSKVAVHNVSETWQISAGKTRLHNFVENSDDHGESSDDHISLYNSQTLKNFYFIGIHVEPKNLLKPVSRLDIKCTRV